MCACENAAFEIPCSQDCTEMHIPENCKGRRPRAAERVRGLGLREVLREAG